MNLCVRKCVYKRSVFLRSPVINTQQLSNIYQASILSHQSFLEHQVHYLQHQQKWSTQIPSSFSSPSSHPQQQWQVLHHFHIQPPETNHTSTAPQHRQTVWPRCSSASPSLQGTCRPPTSPGTTFSSSHPSSGLRT